MNPNRIPPRRRRTAVTLLELLVVVLIIGILATIATGVYIDQVGRARVAATQDLIGQLKIAITRYEIDLGVLPPSGSATVFPPPAVSARQDGSGLLQLALVHSMSGSASTPASTLWRGPYIDIHHTQIETDGVAIGDFDILDAWGNNIIYINSLDYAATGTDFTGGVELFQAGQAGANPNLPAPNPYYAQGETYYNPSTYQIYSPGPDGLTFTGTPNYRGTAADDVNNFGY